MKSLKRKALNVTLLQLTVIYTSVLSLTCKDEQYRLILPDRCCDKCPPGTRVLDDCYPGVNYYTKCGACEEGTFMNVSTSRRQCYPCTNRICEGPGLIVKPCSRSVDSVCVPDEGFFCVKSNGDSCVSAQRHSECKPGQYITQQGTASSDTVCLGCTEGTFSDGTRTSCQPHTQCENEVTVKSGTSSSDTVCGGDLLFPIFIGVSIFVIILLFIILGLVKAARMPVLVKPGLNSSVKQDAPWTPV